MDDVLLTAAQDRSAYPLWMLFSVELLKQTGDFQKALPFYRDLEGGKYAPLFTDKDLAQRFMEENPNDKNEFLPIENKARLCHILKLYLQGGVSDVGTDFSSRELNRMPRYGQLRKIEAVLKDLAGDTSR